MPFLDPQQRKDYAKQYYELNKDKIKLRASTYAKTHSSHCREKNKKWCENNFEYVLWKRARDSSRIRKLEFDITKEDIIIPTHCPYLGIELTTTLTGQRLDSNASLDRIDNTIGYIPSNIQVISSKANYMKRNASIEELINFAQGILKHHTG